MCEGCSVGQPTAHRAHTGRNVGRVGCAWPALILTHPIVIFAFLMQAWQHLRVVSGRELAVGAQRPN